MLNFLVARRKLDRADFEASALWGAYECARCGITSLADTAFDGQAVVRAAGAAGLRARVYQEVFGLDDATLPRTMERFEAVIGRPAGRGGPAGAARSRSASRPMRRTPCRSGSTGRRRASRAAPASASPLTWPSRRPKWSCWPKAPARSPRPTAWRSCGPAPPGGPPRVRPIEYVAAAGALTPETLVIHAVEVDHDEVAVLAASGAAVAHCPRSNARLRCGVAPVAEFLAAGVPVGLGTDSLASNDSLDMFAEMRAALAGAECALSADRGAERRDRRRRRRPCPAHRRGRPADGHAGRGAGPRVGAAHRQPRARQERRRHRGAPAGVGRPRRPAPSLSPATAAGSGPGPRRPGATAGDVRMTMAAGSVVFDGGQPPGRRLSPATGAAREKLGLKG